MERMMHTKIYQSQQEAQSSGLIRRILLGIIAAPLVYAAVWSVFMLAYVFGG